ncbi:hypothetical protein TPA0910_84330 [Streptomyces hygroscopicus subsp. sporocinereus]|uniref:Uncharacterized protein n=1 Tax=Streptomyces hygroscopicus TaxID=1912 RepID=A0ABQ3UEI4_STRHY|nr:hypothetical protein [Streptomyces hygroscopicus]GHJ34000.1 hypothetical protein TPA0910_84330 [Streptomyces hygroscopicus]
MKTKGWMKIKPSVIMRMPGIVAVAAGSPAPCRLRTAMAGTVVAPHEFTEGKTFFLVTDEEEPGWIRLVLHADSRALTPPEVRGFLYGVERVGPGRLPRRPDVSPCETHV